MGEEIGQVTHIRANSPLNRQKAHYERQIAHYPGKKPIPQANSPL